MMKHTKISQKSGITLIGLVVTIIVLLILAGVAITTLTEENGVLTKTIKAVDKTDTGRLDELVRLSINSLMIGSEGKTSEITPNMIAEEVNRMDNRTDVKAQKNSFPTNIIFTKEAKQVKVNLDVNSNLEIAGVTDVVTDNRIYSEDGIDESMIAPEDLFEYEIISDGKTASIATMDKLPVKTARITRIKPKYCDWNTGHEDDSDTYYNIIYEGTRIDKSLVIPYQVELSGELYTIVEVELWVNYTLPNVEEIIYPNTVTSLGRDQGEGDQYGSIWAERLRRVVLPETLRGIPTYYFYRAVALETVKFPSQPFKIRGGCVL